MLVNTPGDRSHWPDDEPKYGPRSSGKGKKQDKKQDKSSKKAFIPHTGTGRIWMLGKKFYVYMTANNVVAVSSVPLPQETEIAWLQNRCVAFLPNEVKVWNHSRLITGQKLRVVVGDPMVLTVKYIDFLSVGSRESRALIHMLWGHNLHASDGDWIKTEYNNGICYLDPTHAIEYGKFKQFIKEYKATL